MNRRLLENFEIDKNDIYKKEQFEEPVVEQVLEEGHLKSTGRHGRDFRDNDYDAVVSFLLSPYPEHMPDHDDYIRDLYKKAYKSFIDVLLPAEKAVEMAEEDLTKQIDNISLAVTQDESSAEELSEKIKNAIEEGEYDLIDSYAPGYADGIKELVDNGNNLVKALGNAVAREHANGDLAAMNIDRMGRPKELYAKLQDKNAGIYYTSTKYFRNAGKKQPGEDHLHAERYVQVNGYSQEIDGEKRSNGDKSWMNSGHMPMMNGNGPSVYKIFQDESYEQKYFEELRKKQSQLWKYRVCLEIKGKEQKEDTEWFEEEDSAFSHAHFLLDSIDPGDEENADVVFYDAPHNAWAVLKRTDFGEDFSIDNVAQYIDEHSDDTPPHNKHEEDEQSSPMAAAAGDLIDINKQESEEQQVERKNGQDSYGDALELNVGDRVEYRKLGGKSTATVVNVERGAAKYGYDEVEIEPDYGTQHKTYVAGKKFLTPLDESFNGLFNTRATFSSVNYDELSRSDSAVVKYMLKEGYSEKTINSFLRKRGKK